MHTYIALLRGINVGGQKIIKMADLKRHFEELNFKHIRTYIQSGNILFDSEKTAIQSLEMKIMNLISSKYGFVVPTIIISAEELKLVVSNNPFLKDPSVPLNNLYVIFFSKEPEIEGIEQLKNYVFTNEIYKIEGKIMYLMVPNGYSNTKLNTTFLEKTLNITATARNWNTTCKLYKMTSN